MRELAFGSHYLILSQHIPVFNFNAGSKFRLNLFFLRHWGFKGLVRLHIHYLNVVAHESKYLACFFLYHRDFEACVYGTDNILLSPSCDAYRYNSSLGSAMLAWLGFFVFNNFAGFPVYDYVMSDL